MLLRELVSILRFDIDAKPLDDLNSKLNEVKGQISAVSNNLGQLANRVRRAGRDMTLFLTVPIIGMGTAAVKAAAETEKYQTTFENLLGSAEKAKKLMADLFKFESKTPFTIKQVMDFTQMLLNAKVPAENITRELMKIGDVALGDPEKMHRIIYAYSQVKNLGRLTGMELRQFTEALVPMTAALAHVTGKKISEIPGMISKREISFDILQKALDYAAEQRQGLLIKQSKTLVGLWSSLVSATYRFRVALGELIVKALHLKGVALALISGLNILTEILKKIPPWITTIIFLFVGLVAIAGPLLWITGALAGAYINLAVALKMVGGSMIFATGATTGLNVALGGLLTTLGVVAGLVAIAVSALLIFQDVYTYVVYGKAHTVWPAWYKFWEDMGAKIHQAVLWVQKFINLMTTPFRAISNFGKGAIPNKEIEPLGIFDSVGTTYKNVGKFVRPTNMFGQPIGPDWGKFGNKTNNVIINMEMPAGTPQQHLDQVEKGTQDIFHRFLNKTLNDSLAMNG